MKREYENSSKHDQENMLLKTKVKHLKNELFLVRQEHEEAQKKYYGIYSQLERKIQERTRKLKESEERFRDMATCSSDWIWEIDHDYLYRYASDNVDKVLGYHPEEIVGKTPFDFMPEKEARVIRQKVLEIAAEKGKIEDMENWIVHKNGDFICFQTSGVPMLDGNNNLLGYRGVAKNITAKKRIEEEREKLILELQDAIDRIKTLKGLLPICSSCKKIRDDTGYWNQIDAYIEIHSDASFTHGICPECMKKLYGDQEWYKKKFNKS